MEEETHYEDAIRNVNALKALVASDGWKIFVDIANEQMHNRREKIVLQPLSTIDEALPQEFMKGEVAGVILMLRMPDIQIEVCEEVLDALKKKDDENGGEEEDGDTSD